MEKRIIKYAVIVVSLFIILGFVLPTWTPKLQDKNSISTLEEVEINGTQLTLMIRGQNKDNPIILVVHGGPSCSEIPFIRKYQEK